MVTISKFRYDNPRFQNLMSRGSGISNDVEAVVKQVIEDIRNRGDVALHEYMKKFDGVDLNQIGLMVSDEEFEEAKKSVSNEFKVAIREACDNIIRYHKRQIPVSYEEKYDDGVIVERKYRPIENVAVTVPGANGALISTLYMNLIPAIVAGVPNIYVITKPGRDGKIDKHLLYVADYLGVRNYYKISGAQGLAAVALGTETVKKVDAISGPGNNYTQMAKKLLYGEVKIDSLAGPSEIAIIADENADPAFIAADMMSQAEHGTGFEASTAFCLSEKQAYAVNEQIKKLARTYNLIDATKITFQNYGDIFVVDSLDEAVDAVNKIAPEHAEVLCDQADRIAENIVNAGAVFVGAYSTEPVGDYYCGSNHILPTCGTARFSAGMSVSECMRGYSVIKYTESALKKNADSIIRIAETEQMYAHALAVKVRK